MKEHKIMSLFYAAMIGVPVLMLLITICSFFGYVFINYILGILLAVGCIVYGILGFREVFIHG